MDDHPAGFDQINSPLLNRVVIGHKPQHGLLVFGMQTRKRGGIAQTVAQEWIQQGIEKGMQRGLERGCLETLIDILETRFGPLAAPVQQHLTAAWMPTRCTR